ncbi:hypothetical protein, partial [Streptomyces sp. SID1121]|uniref:hypothetical protein n=1 Tax=Streptomyces sp. SID1121 TaxID=3425888 RepID=UPI004056A171
MASSETSVSSQPSFRGTLRINRPWSRWFPLLAGATVVLKVSLTPVDSPTLVEVFAEAGLSEGVVFGGFEASGTGRQFGASDWASASCTGPSSSDPRRSMAFPPPDRGDVMTLFSTLVARPLARVVQA